MAPVEPIPQGGVVRGPSARDDDAIPLTGAPGRASVARLDSPEFCTPCTRGECFRCQARGDDGWCCCGEDYQFELAIAVEDDNPFTKPLRWSDRLQGDDLTRELIHTWISAGW